MKVILSHAGKQHAYHVAKTLNDLGLLNTFHTSSYITNKALQQFITHSGNTYWSRRFLPGLYGHKIKSNWRFEVKEILYNKIFGQTRRTMNVVYERDVKFDKYLASKIPAMDGDIFWGFQGSCLESLNAAKAAGKISICELSAAHAPAVLRIFLEEQQLHPEWADSFSDHFFPTGYLNRLCEEPHQSDIVIGASQFTLQTLRESGVAESKLRYLPLGFEVDSIPFDPVISKNNKPVRLLYAGRITQGKGIKYLLEAMKHFNQKEVELHLIGHVQGSGKALSYYRGKYILHPPMPQYELFKIYQDFDALILPSLFEGFGLVIIEAMAAGLPVITTPNSIGPELINHGINGYIIPIRDVASIVKAIEDFCNKSFHERILMRRNARQAVLNYSWDAYRHRLTNFINSIK